MARLVIDIAWQIEGPFRTAGPDTFASFDSTFHRAAGRVLSVPKTHVKGKVLEAIHTYLTDEFRISKEALAWWFGEEREKDGRENLPERLFFSDLRPETQKNPRVDLNPGSLNSPPDLASVGPCHGKFQSLLGANQKARRGFDSAKRTAIDGETHTAANATLREEEIQPRGLSLWWNGRIETADADQKPLEALASLLEHAARCVEQFGADKTDGYGVVRDVCFEAKIGDKVQNVDLEKAVRVLTRPAPTCRAKAAEPSRPAKWKRYYLAVVPFEPVYIGGVKRPDSHFHPGLDYLTGSALKGAVAAALNLESGMPLIAEIGPGHPAEKGFERLVRGFTSLRFLHAAPGSGSGQTWQRGFVVPLSAYADKKKPERVWDAALSDVPNGVLPHFAPDCDDLRGFLDSPGSAGTGLSAIRAEQSVVLRTAIDAESLLAAKEKLFGYSQISELTEAAANPFHRQVFLCAVDVPDHDGRAAELWAQLVSVLPHIRLGKMNAAVAVHEVKPAKTQDLDDRIASFKASPIVLTLASDTLLPLDLSQVTNTCDMTGLYDTAWKRVLGQLGYSHDPKSKLITSIFAQQELRGGWAGRRGGGYRCFYLTRAGSVFVTSVAANACPGSLKDALKNIEDGGAPVLKNDLDWRNCPYVPENGYGEVAVCHPWHLSRSAANA